MDNLVELFMFTKILDEWSHPFWYHVRCTLQYHDSLKI